jgi:pimeloyl-ACP methyl ester carboxylesterase
MPRASLLIVLCLIVGGIGPGRESASTTLLARQAGAAPAQPLRIAGAPCDTPPALHCPDANCSGGLVTNGGSVVEPKTGRTYFLDYPCDLKPGETVTFILSLHGGGSYGNWQRHYFPLVDYVAKHRLVVATPFSPRRVWAAEDDEYLQNIVSFVIEQIGRDNIKSVWLAGHSQGGATSSRLVCTDFFKTKVDGFLSLSGGRVGGAAPRAANAGPPPAPGAPAGAAAPGRGGLPGIGRGPAPDTSCDFSHIYTTGEHEIASLPSASTRAEKYNCGAQTKQGEIVDTRAGYIYDRGRQNPGSKQWGLLPRPGKAHVFVYPNCSDGRVVADVVRIDKGHTEGLEPNVTEALVKLMLSARGGKLQQGAADADRQ